jgi:YhcN/YlaJ family sporulation lipoprotein
MKLTAYLLIIMMGLSGCQTASPSPNNQASPPGGQEQVEVRQTVPKEEAQKEQRINNQTAQEIAERLVKIAIRVPSVNDATAVVFGRNAIVGIDVPAKLDRSRIGTIKYSVAEALREDPYGARTVVTADTDTMQRLREIAADVRKGRPITGFTEELADMAGRLMPQLPHHTEPRDSEGNEYNPTPANRNPENQ